MAVRGHLLWGFLYYGERLPKELLRRSHVPRQAEHRIGFVGECRDEVCC